MGNTNSTLTFFKEPTTTQASKQTNQDGNKYFQKEKESLNLLKDYLKDHEFNEKCEELSLSKKDIIDLVFGGNSLSEITPIPKQEIRNKFCKAYP